MKQYIEKATDVNVRGDLLYVKAVADGFVYSDAECTTKVNKETLVHLFQMNTIVIVDGNDQYRPIFITIDSTKNYVDLTYIKSVTNTATLTLVHSSEYTA